MARWQRCLVRRRRRQGAAAEIEPRPKADPTAIVDLRWPASDGGLGGGGAGGYLSAVSGSAAGSDGVDGRGGGGGGYCSNSTQSSGGSAQTRTVEDYALGTGIYRVRVGRGAQSASAIGGDGGTGVVIVRYPYAL